MDWPYAFSYSVDSVQGQGLTLTLPSSTATDSELSLGTDTPGDVRGGESEIVDAPRYDILDVRILETPTQLGFEVDLALVDGLDDDWSLGMLLGLPASPIYEITARGTPDAPTVDALTLDDMVEFDVEVEIIAGTPGTVRLMIERSEIEPVDAGDRITLAMIFTGRDVTPDEGLAYDGGDARVGIDPDLEQAFDAWLGGAWRFQFSS